MRKILEFDQFSWAATELGKKFIHKQELHGEITKVVAYGAYVNIDNEEVFIPKMLIDKIDVRGRIETGKYLGKKVDFYIIEFDGSNFIGDCLNYKKIKDSLDDLSIYEERINYFKLTKDDNVIPLNTHFSYTFLGRYYHSKELLINALTKVWIAAASKIYKNKKIQNLNQMELLCHSNEENDRLSAILDEMSKYYNNLAIPNLENAVLFEFLYKINNFTDTYFWKTKEYKNSNGDFDSDTFVKDLYDDAINKRDFFDELVSVRTVKIILEMELADSAKIDELTQRINRVASSYIEMAKLMLVQILKPDFITRKITNNKYSKFMDLFSMIFTPENLDDALEFGEKSNPIVAFCYSYANNMRIPAVLSCISDKFEYCQIDRNSDNVDIVVEILTSMCNINELEEVLVSIMEKSSFFDGME